MENENEKHSFKRLEYCGEVYKIDGLEHDKNKGVYEIKNLGWDADFGEAYPVKGLNNTILLEYIESGREGELEGLIFSLVTKSEEGWKAKELTREAYTITRNLEASYLKESNEIRIKYGGWRDRSPFWGYRECDIPEPQRPIPESWEVDRRIKLE